MLCGSPVETELRRNSREPWVETTVHSLIHHIQRDTTDYRKLSELSLKIIPTLILKIKLPVVSVWLQTHP